VSSFESPWAWGAFLAMILAVQAVDLRKRAAQSDVSELRSAIGFTVLWLLLALGFAAYLYADAGREASLSFLTGYLIEKSLSVDNVFVFAVIFSALGIPQHLQQRVLVWGVLGALVLRALMVLLGAALLARFHWLGYVFGALLVVTGLKLLRKPSAEPASLTDGLALRTLRRVLPHTPTLHGERFFVRDGGRLLATPLFMALVLVELSDVVFALDSVPAVFAVTRDPFIVLTSNVFAILGLRSLFFVLSAAIVRFAHLSYGLAVVLVFVGLKMCLTDVLHVPSGLSLAVVAITLVTAALCSPRPGRGTRPADASNATTAEPSATVR